MDNRCINEKFQEIAEDLIIEREELKELRESDVTVILLDSDSAKKNKREKVLGQCEKVADKWKWAVPCDFTITLFKPNIIGLTEDQIKILIFHELLHIGIDGDKMFIRDHDLKDFKVIIDEFGVNWNATN